MNEKGHRAILGARFRALIERLNDLQIRRPVVPLVVVGIITVFFGYFASKLELRTQYEALLPENAPSVVELRRVRERTAGSQVALLLLEGDDTRQLRAMGDALLPALRALGPDTVTTAADGIHAGRDFLEHRAGLFLDTAELESLKADVDRRWDYEVSKAEGSLLDENEAPPPGFSPEELKSRFSKKLRGGKDGRGIDAYPDGYFQSDDGKALVVVVRSPITAGDLPRITHAVKRIKETVKEVQASHPDFSPIRVSYAGELVSASVEYGVIRGDLMSVGVEGVCFVLLVVLLYFRRLRALFVMGATIIVGLIWTFGLTQLVIGHLNTATGFLVSIVAGNGINVGILYQSRYFEERQKGVLPAQALRTAVLATWQPTVIAAIAAAASYGSLLVIGFRGFRDFGFIAAVGMLLCWVVKTLMVPPLLILTDRWSPMEKSKRDGLVAKLRSNGLSYGNVAAGLVARAPRVLLAGGLLVAVIGAVATAQYVRHDPMEYDLRKVQNDRSKTEALYRAGDYADKVLGSSQGAMVVVTDTPAEARELMEKLQARYDAAPEGDKPFVALHSLWSFIPSSQEEKLPTFLALGERLLRARERGFINDTDWTKIEPMLPPPDLRPFGIEDLPASLATPFTEANGTRGTIVAIEPQAGSSNDLHYLIRYSNSFRETTLDSGKVIRGSGRAVIFADILNAIARDAPRAIAVSLAMTLLTVFITFGKNSYCASVLLALLMGICGVGAFLYFTHQRLNFMNFVALPITFGIGVDYAVNVIQRYRADGGTNILSALRTTGGAVMLCSLTTTVGYLALISSLNQAIRSLGLIAVIGELACVLAAVLALPAFWLLHERKKRMQGQAAAEAPPTPSYWPDSRGPQHGHPAREAPQH
jgi:predicted RND superfamily exporter protein